jgi:hypothetical protein
MPIRIAESPEPLSPASHGTAPLVALSDAHRLLVQDLERYCKREINGRSFLISGHRGAGKTTLVNSAVFDVWRKSYLGARPLLVLLHGPSLFPPRPRGSRETPSSAPQRHAGGQSPGPAGAESAGAPDCDASQRGQVARSEPPRPMSPPVSVTVSLAGGQTTDSSSSPLPHAAAKDSAAIALEQITLCLHRAVAREFGAFFRRFLVSTRIPSASPGTMSIEVSELAAQFELELYECPSASRLRELWRLAGALQSGVLSPSRTREPDRAARELLALASTCEAYRRIAGKYRVEEEQRDAAQTKRESSFEIGAIGQYLVRPAVSLLSGAAVGGSLLARQGAGSDHALTAAAAGVLAALGASLVFRFSASRSRETSHSRQSSFLFDYSAATLDRVLPLLIERLFDAGLAPVFMVDELDKVKNLSQRILPMVHHLKKFVAENAFFCFLTDRLYYEEMTYRTRTRAYPLEYTYFSHRLFVSYRPRDLHAYLEKVLEEPVPPAPPGPSVAPAGTDANEIEKAFRVGLSEAQDEIRRQFEPRLAEYSRAVADRDVLPYVLLHRAQMHLGDLCRRLGELRDDQGAVGIPLGEVRTNDAYRLDVLIQIAVEMVLDQGDLKSRLERAAGRTRGQAAPARTASDQGGDLRRRIEREPEFSRLAYDALYYLSRRWRRGEVIELGSRDEERFGEYLTQRMESGETARGRKPEAAGPDKGTPPDGQQQHRAGPVVGVGIAAEDRRLLFEAVRLLAELLSDPALFRAELDRRDEKRRQEEEARRRSSPIPSADSGAWERRIKAVRDVLGRWLRDNPGAPLLRRRQAHQFSWNYDVSGVYISRGSAEGPAGAPVDVPAVVAAPPATPAAAPPAAGRRGARPRRIARRGAEAAGAAEPSATSAAAMEVTETPGGGELKGIAPRPATKTAHASAGSSGADFPTPHARSWKDDAELIDRLRDFLFALDPTLDLGLLTTHLRLLPISPDWQVVEKAMGRLATPDGGRPEAAGFHADVQCVHDFARRLEPCSELLAHALLCGAFVARFLVASQDRSLRLGLELIVEAYRLGARPGPEVAPALSDLLREVAKKMSIYSSRWGRLASTSSGAIFSVVGGDWMEEVSEALGDIRDATMHPEDHRSQHLDAYWQQWEGRIQSFLGGSTPPDPILDDVLVAASELASPGRLKLDLQAMNFVEWGAIFATALADSRRGDAAYRPFWVAAAALLALGFGLTTDGDVRSWVKEAKPYKNREEADLARECAPLANLIAASAGRPQVSSAAGRSVRRSLVVVKRVYGSLVNGWRPSATSATATLALTADQALDLVQRLGESPPLPVLPPLACIAFEAPTEPAAATQEGARRSELLARVSSLVSARYGTHTSPPAPALVELLPDPDTQPSSTLFTPLVRPASADDVRTPFSS